MTAEKPATSSSVDTTEFARTLAEIALRSNHLFKEHLAEQSRESGEEPVDELGVGKAFTDLAAKLMTDPFKLAEAGMRMWQDYFMLWQNTMKRAMGDEPVPVVEAPKSDNRFRSELWQNNQKTVSEVEGLDAQTARKVKFFTRQYVDALAPTNFVMTNPEVLKTTVETGGKNLLDGLNHLLHDL